MKEIEIHIPIHPRSFQGHEIGENESGRARLYSPREKKEYIDGVALLAIQSARANAKKAGLTFRRFPGLVFISSLTFYFATPHEILHDSYCFAKDVPDIDNMLKPLFDALEKFVITDDRYIVRIANLHKVWAEKSGIDIRLVDAS